MKFTTVMYLLGMFLVLLGERMIGGDDSWRWGLDGVGALCPNPKRVSGKAIV